MYQNPQMLIFLGGVQDEGGQGGFHHPRHQQLARKGWYIIYFFNLIFY